MKPMGAIPAGFLADAAGSLTIGGKSIEALVERAGDTPLFVYDIALIRATVERLRRALPPEVTLHYAIKANPMPALVKAVAGMVDGLDVASEGEMRIALTSGIGHISFAGPGKRDRELEAAVLAGVTLNLESEGEAARVLKIAERIGTTPKLAVRVNPEFDLKGSGMRMGGGAKPFGVDTDRAVPLVKALIAAGADWRGFHIFAGSQALDADAICETQAQTIALAGQLADQIGTPPPLVNLGGGFGIPYFSTDKPLDVTRVGANLSALLASRPAILATSRFAVELGRYLVGEAGVYLCRIIDGEVFLVTDGGLHHQLAASGNFGTVVRRNYPLANASKFSSVPCEVASVVGCLCTPLDRLGDQVSLPLSDVGDVIAVFMAGAYGFSASPANFLGHPAAREMMVNE
jgi:diaminopimelate decarboxylase